jgi:hypothetical protein
MKIEEDIVALYESGLGIKSVCKIVNKGQSTVSRILKRNNVTMRRGSTARNTKAYKEKRSGRQLSVIQKGLRSPLKGGRNRVYDLPLFSFATNKSLSQKAKDKYRQKAKDRYREKYATNPTFRLKEQFRSRLKKLISDPLLRRDHRFAEVIGCSEIHFMNWIQSQFSDGMHWHNQGPMGKSGVWQVDHIVPVSSDGPWQLIWNWRNMRPLWSEDNADKGSSFNAMHYSMIESTPDGDPKPELLGFAKGLL